MKPITSKAKGENKTASLRSGHWQLQMSSQKLNMKCNIIGNKMTNTKMPRTRPPVAWIQAITFSRISSKSFILLTSRNFPAEFANILSGLKQKNSTSRLIGTVIFCLFKLIYSQFCAALEYCHATSSMQTPRKPHRSPFHCINSSKSFIDTFIIQIAAASNASFSPSMINS